MNVNEAGVAHSMKKVQRLFVFLSLGQYLLFLLLNTRKGIFFYSHIITIRDLKYKIFCSYPLFPFQRIRNSKRVFPLSKRKRKYTAPHNIEITLVFFVKLDSVIR